jgi:hypothetical protein
MHVLPRAFHRIRHYGLLANRNRAANVARARGLLAAKAHSKQPATPFESAPNFDLTTNRSKRLQQKWSY